MARTAIDNLRRLFAANESGRIPQSQTLRAPLTVVEAAAQLGLSPRQLHYAVRSGAPVAKRGAKGKGNKTLVNVDEIRQWMRNRNPTDAAHRKLARDLIAVIAENTVLQFRAQSGPHKAALLGSLVAGFFSTAATIQRQLGLPPLGLADIPTVIRQMDAANVHFSQFSILGRVLNSGGKTT